MAKRIEGNIFQPNFLAKLYSWNSSIKIKANNEIHNSTLIPVKWVQHPPERSKADHWILFQNKKKNNIRKQIHKKIILNIVWLDILNNVYKFRHGINEYRRFCHAFWKTFHKGRISKDTINIATIHIFMHFVAKYKISGEYAQSHIRIHGHGSVPMAIFTDVSEG